MCRSIGFESADGSSLTVTRATYWWSWKALTPATFGRSMRMLGDLLVGGHLGAVRSSTSRARSTGVV